MDETQVARTGWVMITLIKNGIGNRRRVVRDFFAKLAKCHKSDPQ
jgi:hypothetical protein